MAEVATLARPYAEAVFDLADQSNSLAEWAPVLATMAQFAAQPEVRAFIANPNLGAKPLYTLFVSLCGDDLSTEARDFVRVLIANDRLALLPEIHAQFVELKNAREGLVQADIRSAFPLNNAQVSSLVADLERRFKRRVHPRVTTDKELIGGVRIAVGDEVIDGSVRGRLEEMAVALKS